jgi:hypothetical protein
MSAKQPAYLTQQGFNKLREELPSSALGKGGT